MKVLVACEYSGRVREAFRKRGHDAWSCDIEEAADGSPHHLRQDVRQVLRGGFLVADESPSPLWEAFVSGAIGSYNGDQMDAKDPRTGQWEPYPSESVSRAFEWDLVIAFPPCTYLCSAGIHWNARRPERAAQTDEAEGFFRLFTSLTCPWAIENPVGVMSSRWRKPDQIIQPYFFGDSAKKTTCLWLNNLPKLTPTKLVDPGEFRINPDGRKYPAWMTTAGPHRNVTFQGVADAMAERWG